MAELTEAQPMEQTESPKEECEGRVERTDLAVRASPARLLSACLPRLPDAGRPFLTASLSSLGTFLLVLQQESSVPPMPVYLSRLR